MRKADMELQKLENLTEHKDEIYSRPKKEWFISGKEKRDIQDRAREEHGEKVEPVEKTKRISKFPKGRQQRGRQGRPEGR
jgi:ATP-dependent RNA helicase DDX27